MKRLVRFFPIFLLMTGCAQLFDGNAFKSVDQPAALSASAIAGESDSTVVSQITYDSSFVSSLKSNSAALTAVQTVLKNAFTASGASTTTVITDAQAYITATNGGSSAGTVVTSALSQLTTLASSASASSAATALQAIFAGQTYSQIQASLTQLENEASAFTAMQTASVPSGGNTVNSTTFFGSTTSKLNLGVTAVLAASVDAFITDNGGGSTGIAALATALANGTTPSYSTAVTNSLVPALTTSTTTTANPYAYLTAVTSVVKT